MPCGGSLCYIELMSKSGGHIDKPEPRWQAILAVLAVAGIYLALPSSLIVGPFWFFPAIIAVSLAPTIVAHGKGHSLNHGLGIINNSIITIALIGSVMLLVRALPSKAEPPLRLLESGAALWITNVIVFALWYWRLDGGGPTEREKRHEFGSHSFLFPQMQIERSERSRHGVSEHWHPRFIDYLFIALTQSSTFGPTDAPLLARWAKLLASVQILLSLCIILLLISRAVGVL
jgi:hypothetical protein